MAVPKPDGRFRICGDFKVTVNQVLHVDQYPLPKVEDLFATLAGLRKFTKLDLSQAYLQLELHPDSMKYCTVNTHQSFYQFTQLPFGIASTPALFQKVMDSILQGVPGVLCYSVTGHRANGGSILVKPGEGSQATAVAWYSNEKEQMLFHEGCCGILGTPSGC